mgnify:CR=1 FL=1
MNEPVLYQEWNAAQWPRSVDAIRYQGWLIKTPFVVVPWCAEHKAPMEFDTTCLAYEMSGEELAGPPDCRLEDPPRHIKLGGSDE